MAGFKPKIDYRDLMNRELERRLRTNPQYSMRAFARDLTLSAPRLSQILNGKCGLSPAAAKTILNKLKLEEHDRPYFLASVDYCHSRNASHRSKAREQLEKYHDQVVFKERMLDEYLSVADWYSMPILELTEVEGFQSDPQWIAQKLKIKPEQASAALQRLLRLKLLECIDGRYVRPEYANSFWGKTDVAAARNLYYQIVDLAKDAITDQTLDQRLVKFLIFAVNRKDIPQIKNLMNEFSRKIADLAAKATPKEAVYCMAMQLYEMTNSENETSS